MRINLGTVVRASVPPAVNGAVWLDRSTSAAFAVSAEFRAALVEYAPGSLRAPTTGHDNLPRSHPVAPKHTYKFADYTVPVKGNLWHPNWNGPGYTDEDGNPGNGTGLAGAGDISEIIGIATFCDQIDYLNANGVTQRVHYYLDWQSGWSEGCLIDDLPNATPGPYADADLKWYRDPYAVDINGDPIDSGVLAAMTSLEFKILENNRAVKYLHGRGYTNVVLNFGGEDWLGWPGVDGNGPWGPDSGTDANDKYHWITDHRTPILQGLVDFIDDQGYTEFEIAISTLESITGGRLCPMPLAQRDRNREHLDYEIDTNGTHYGWIAASCHYRGDWYRFLREPQMLSNGSRGLQYAFITDSGQGSWRELVDYVGDVYSKKLLPMANSVGDAASSLVWAAGIFYLVDMVVKYAGDGLFYISQSDHLAVDFAADLGAGKWVLTPGTLDEDGNGKPPGDLGKVSLPDWQRGLISVQQQIEQIAAGIELAQYFSGLAGDHAHSGFNPSEGLCGMSGGVFTKFPVYHALKTFGPILQRGADLIDATVTETGIVQCFLRYEQDGRHMLAGWLLNKAYEGESPSEVGMAQTVDIEIPTPYLPYFEPQTVRRFSETETTNPLTTGIVSTSGNIITVDLAPFSLTYFETEIRASTLYPNKYRDPGHFHRYVVH